MYHSKKHIRHFIWFPIFILCFGAVLYVWINVPREEARDALLGVTFSNQYASSLGLDWKAAYTAMLDELHIRHIRIPVYWNDSEPAPNEFALNDVEWMLDEAHKRNARVTLAVGRRAPRWPECHEPVWTRSLPEHEVQDAELRMVRHVVNAFMEHPSLERWQVENEPFLGTFGNCPAPDRGFIVKVVDAVRTADPQHRILMTDSGELGGWVEPAANADILGVTMYRLTWNKYIGYFAYPLSPTFYKKKAQIVKPFVDDVIVSELQAEPWAPDGILNDSLEVQFASMNPKRLLQHVQYARQTGFSEVYLWGVEWWYWLKTTQGHPEMWDAARAVYSQ